MRQNNPLAYHTMRLLQLVAGLPDEEYREVIEYIGSVDDELVSLHVAAFNVLVHNWAMFEEECRGLGRCWNQWLPRNVDPKRASAFFNDEIRKVIVKGCIDLAPDWVVPGWVKWVASRLGIDLSPLRKLEWKDLVSRLVHYTVYVWTIRGLSNGYLEFFQSENREYAVVVASHVHWEIVETLAEPLESALEPIKNYVSVTLEKLYERAYMAAMEFASGAERLGLRGEIRNALTSLSESIRQILGLYRKASGGAV